MAVADSFVIGLAIGGGIALIAVLSVFGWIIASNLRPLGWTLVVGLVIFLLTRL